MKLPLDDRVIDCLFSSSGGISGSTKCCSDSKLASKLLLAGNSMKSSLVSVSNGFSTARSGELLRLLSSSSCSL